MGLSYWPQMGMSTDSMLVLSEFAPVSFYMRFIWTISERDGMESMDKPIWGPYLKQILCLHWPHHEIFAGSCSPLL